MEHNESHQSKTDGADDRRDHRDSHHAAGHLRLSSSCQEQNRNNSNVPPNRLYNMSQNNLFFRHGSLENVLPLRVSTSGGETSGLQMRDQERGQFSPRSRRTLMGVELTVAMSLTVVSWLSLSLRRLRLLLLVPVLQFCRRTSIKTRPPSPPSPDQ